MSKLISSEYRMNERPCLFLCIDMRSCIFFFGISESMNALEQKKNNNNNRTTKFITVIIGRKY